MRTLVKSMEKELEMTDAGYNSKLDGTARKLQDPQVDVENLND